MDHSRNMRLIAEAAAAAFAEAGWKWNPGGPHVPRVDEIESTLWELSRNIRPDWEPGTSTATGRLHLVLDDEGDVHVSLDLGTLDGFIAHSNALRQERSS